MLNLSNNSKSKIEQKTIARFRTIQNLSNRPHYKILNKIILFVSILGIIILFLPWTQNISGSGFVTTLKPNQRPQTIQTAIAGRIEKWYIKEGDFVKKGDTILFISEIKEDYFDPNLVGNTKNQVEAKKMALESYDGKVSSLGSQINAIENEKKLKLEQAKNKIKQSLLKIKSDSIDLEAVKTQLKIVNTQFIRSSQLNKEGLKPMTDVEEKRLKQQEVEAKIITQENKFLTSKNEYINTKVEINRILAEYSEKSAKAKSDKFTALSNQYDTEAQVNKLQNQYVNCSIRNGMYYIKAPQSGYINRSLQSGIGETIKEGTSIVSIMPAHYEIAVETYVSPIDLPLISKGEKIRVWFDGWPTIVFSGWPDMSYGTFGGKVIAIENFISENGKYRILIAPDENEAKWPKQLSIGSGAQTIALLNTVPVWFEVWRTLNGFPPNYYKQNTKKDNKEKK
ncbi:HlyD family efflux transporter periplasmic adaptor subunit [Flavobacterium psychrophilum]|uniref:HlyD family secretion protein n=1 Tax=Flavobacterium psychrophilum TaxID=96345 RepID=UPI0004F59404|nr:biotin/lipoyl-binding protein [Flavobacterium psychrophilum]AIN73318.1 biotin attachment protein [Flavobacterium psychrophilum FPG3]EKT2069671.1 HlyD family efflux transporter periplasmic adaptor subunit [Flavobacterium psychrophilum]EKT2071931.1 HlyD family efflux transporter periplasmic adaptor subunit [Flavobacterium psychrophilum]EKT4491453.1 HlyD family efflux transporter periplasmic adaptor subunit [Flavobacterium psychrophilum]MBF2043905.1 HlyD family efflux transporter periplasmic a